MQAARFAIGALLGAVILLWPAPSGRGEASSIAIRPVASLRVGGSGWAQGELINLRPSSAGLLLGDEPAFTSEALRFGIYLSPVSAVDEPFDRARVAVEPALSADGTVDIDVRSSPDALNWCPWIPLSVGSGEVELPAGRFFQYRVEMRGGADDEPRLNSLKFDLSSTGALPLLAAGENPTVRVFATREGLVGRKTANGHTIVERDRFVALPSRRVLSPNGKTDYQVRVSYRGKSTTLPVWDVGPWNTRDNYWDEARDIFSDLPRFTPQARAAWQDNYNGGRDQFNRWVSLPASIDIADGAFIEDLGMGNSDWVDVTFLWVNAASPSTAETPPVTALKPQPRAPGPAADGLTWFFAEGNTRPPFETWFILLNPDDKPAKAYLNYTPVDGTMVRQEVTLNAGARVTVSANQALPDAEFSTAIEATRPIVAERSVYFGADGHSSTGAMVPSTTWYLAEGSSEPPSDTWIVLQNPGSREANVGLTFMKDSGENQTLRLRLQPSSRHAVHANEVVPGAGFATRIVSDQPIVAERTVYLANGGGHAAVASDVTSRSWFLAEGSTEERADTWLLVQNPGRNPANVTITYLREAATPIEQKTKVGATSRRAVSAREVLADERFGVIVQSDQPVVLERVMYFGGTEDGQGTGAHASVGSPELATTWYLAEGSTQPPFNSWVLIANPNGSAAHARLDYLREDGSATTVEYDVGPMSRLTIDVNAHVANAAVSTRVSADRPVVVERTSTFNGGSGGTNSLGLRR